MFAGDIGHGEFQVRFVRSTAPAHKLNVVRLPLQIALCDFLRRMLLHSHQHASARRQDVAIVREYHLG